MKASIVHWNRPRECLATVAALRRSSIALDITIVDNGSTAENRALLLAGLPSGVEFVPLPNNVGWGRAHNRVLRRWLHDESTEYCIVSAHDALPAEGCLEMLLRAMDEHPTWGLACPEYGKWEKPVYSVARGARLVSIPSRIPGQGEVVDYCHGTLAVFRRGCLEHIGIFDERFFAYGDETEIGLRANNYNWRTGLVWGALLVNPGSWTGGPVIAYLWTRNTLRLARQFGGRRGLALRMGFVLAATLRDWIRRRPSNGMSSPSARWRGFIDYFRGATGAPPPAIVSLSE